MSIRPGRYRAFTLVELPAARRRGRAAFTLIELLVVVAILMVLLSLLTPMLRRAKELAYTSICANNEKLHGVAIHQFVTTYNGYFPPAVWSRPSGGYAWYSDPPYWEFHNSDAAAADTGSMVNGESWCEDFHVNTFYPFYKHIAAEDGWICPGHPHADQATKEPYIFGYHDPKSYRSAYRTYYLMNLQSCPKWKPCGPYEGREKRRLEQIRKPYALFLFVDRRDYANDIDPDRTGSFHSIYTNVTSANTGHGPDDIGVHHQKGFNACFADGHVRRIDMGLDPAKPYQYINGMDFGPLRKENYDPRY